MDPQGIRGIKLAVDGACCVAGLLACATARIAAQSPREVERERERALRDLFTTISMVISILARHAQRVPHVEILHAASKCIIFHENIFCRETVASREAATKFPLGLRKLLERDFSRDKRSLLMPRANHASLIYKASSNVTSRMNVVIAADIRVAGKRQFLRGYSHTKKRVHLALHRIFMEHCCTICGLSCDCRVYMA